MRIAVVDDDPYIISQITCMLSSYWNEKEYVQDDFVNGYEFIKSIHQSILYDLSRLKKYLLK